MAKMETETKEERNSINVLIVGVMELLMKFQVVLFFFLF